MSTLVDAPARVDGVELVGEMVGSGYRAPPSLVRRGDGQVLQLTPLLYLVLRAVDGRRSCAEIADLVSHELRRHVTEEHVRSVVDGHLRPLGLLSRADGSQPELKRANPLLGLSPRVAVTDPRSTRRLTDPFRVLFSPVIATVVVLGFVAVVGWVFFERGLGTSAYDAFERPHLLLLVFVVSVLSGGFHEFGHAAAARYSGAQPGAMGLGLYLVWPAFYTDVTDSYRLGRAGRIRTDLGGLYFNAVVVVLTFVWWWATGWEALLLLVATQVLQMVQQLLPLLRFDGYHVLADIAGVPDLYHRIRPTLTGLLPHRWKAPENRVLRPRARAVITLWVLITIPMMALMLLGLVAAVPRLLGSAAAVVREDLTTVARAWNAGDGLDVAGHTLQVLGVVPGERGLFASFLPELATGTAEAARPAALPAAGTAASQRLSSDDPLVAAFQEDTELPTKGDPVLAIVLVPHGTSTDSPSSAASPSSAPSPSTEGSDEPWVFPFNQPLPPDEGDNQALAVATDDNSIVYDVAFALVWVEDDEVLNVNEAHAYASCSDCVAVAVAFQVVLIMDDAQVIVPQNLAVAANYDCYRCITAAIASQLVLSVQEEPGQEELLALGEVWNQLLLFANTITSYTLAEITAQLAAFQTQIIAILGSAPPVESAPSAAATNTDSTDDLSDPSSSASPTEVPTASPTDQSSPSAPGPTQPSTATPTSATPTQDTTTPPTPTPTPTPTQDTTTPSSPAGESTTPVSPTEGAATSTSPLASSTTPESSSASP